MNRYFQLMARKKLEVTPLSKQALKPLNKGKLHTTDLIKMYDLRRYHLEHHPESSQSLKHVRELEILHSHLNFKMTFQLLFKCLFFFFAANFFYKYYVNKLNENKNWAKMINAIHKYGMLAELDEGGEEGDE